MNQLTGFKNQPKWTISARIPQREMAKGMPGPGQYGMTHVEKDKFHSAPKISMASGQRDSKEWGTFPGPGQYSPPLPGKTLPAWGFSSETRLHEVKKSRGPAPGAYETRTNLDGLHFSVSSRPSGGGKRSLTPGPGQYKPNYDAALEKAGSVSFGSSSRGELAMSKTPGPGQYEAMPILGGSIGARAMPRYTIAGKRSQSTSDVTPGPGPAASQFTRH